MLRYILLYPLLYKTGRLRHQYTGCGNVVVSYLLLYLIITRPHGGEDRGEVMPALLDYPDGFPFLALHVLHLTH
jgi:hypothetical protein